VSSGEVEDRLDRRDDRDVVAEDGEIPDAFALSLQDDSAVLGIVVSKPRAKNTTSFAGFARAMASASVGEYTIRTSRRRFACSRLLREPARASHRQTS
jgi:hypothetical protein